MLIKTGCCIVHKDKVLLVQLVGNGDQNGKWGPPAGGLNENESLKEGALREVYEETGLKVEINKLLKVTLAPKYKDVGYCFVFYLASTNDNPDVKLQKEEASNYAWASIEEIENDKYDLRKKFLKETLISALADRKNEELINIVEI